MGSINDLVDGIAQELQPDPERISLANRRADQLVKAIKRSQDETFQLIKAKPIGSLTRGTGIHGFADFDMLLEFHYPALTVTHGKLRDPAGTIERLRGLVSRLRAGLVSLDNIQIRGQGHSVGVAYPASNIRIDLVPAVKHKGGVYLIPERSTKSWIQTSPSGIRRWQQKAIDKQPEIPTMVRLVKGFMQARGGNLKIPGYALEIWITKASQGYTRLRALAMLERIFSRVAVMRANGHVLLIGERDPNAKITICDPLTDVNVASKVTPKQRTLFIKKCEWAVWEMQEARELFEAGERQRAEWKLRRLFGAK